MHHGLHPPMHTAHLLDCLFCLLVLSKHLQKACLAVFGDFGHSAVFLHSYLVLSRMDCPLRHAAQVRSWQQEQGVNSLVTFSQCLQMVVRTLDTNIYDCQPLARIAAESNAMHTTFYHPDPQ